MLYGWPVVTGLSAVAVVVSVGGVVSIAGVSC